ncbi:delta(14)-sterol reductase isoform X1 [Sinocyclocheilus rhinocerous]|nr:PREDICTED: delta(14)-sterol reductase-like isoform X1 [Sinocyclocheilus rhinocerous]XP_016430262.1 PREDICTED: delta(14)-sterol reductase-like isoform X1 [Sinocyclocheilus rhinocerous]
MTTHQPEHQRHRNRSLQDTGNVKLEYGADDEGKGVVQVHSRWNNIHLSLVCVLLGISLIMILDGCRSSSESWVLLGSAGTLIWDWTSVCVVLLFTVLQVALYYLPVGQVTEGKMGCDGKRLKYKLNGLHAFLLTVVLMLVLWFAGVLRAGAGTVRIFSLVSAAMAVSLIFSLTLFLCPIRTPSSAHVTYNTGMTPQLLPVYPQRLRSEVMCVCLCCTAKPLLKFVLGHSMDPRLGLIDVKHFVMVRVGFIGWAVMDLNYLLTAVEMKNSSLALLLVVVFQLIYILDFLVDEGSVLTTKEFTDEPIGFIMILGEFIWIPFFSSLPAYFLLQRPNHIHFLSAVPICLLFAAGFLMYYLSNEQKDGFRRNPSDPAYARLNTIRSPAGSSLLVSGWFGWVRHPNYSGDILMMFAWCLPCGFTSVLPYLPALQCFHLLRQRANEIEESCLKKHRDAWREYCRRVPYKLLPCVY